MKQHLFKPICILLTVVIAFSGACLSVPSYAEPYLDPFTLDLRTDKASYRLGETVSVSATVTNSDAYEYHSVVLDVHAPDYSCTGGSTSGTFETLSSGNSAALSFSAVLHKDASGLRFFQKLLLVLKYLFRTMSAILGVQTGQHCQKTAVTVVQGGIRRTVELRIYYTARLVTTTDIAHSTVPSSETTASTTSSGEWTAGFSMTMLNVGQGLSLLVRCGTHSMLYDGGGRSASSYVVSYLKNHDVTNLDYMFVSHYDEDHLAGLVGVLNTTCVDTVVSPNYTTDSAIYQSYLTKLSANGAKVLHPSVGQTFSLGQAELKVLGPKHYTYDSENSFSVVLRISYGVFSCIITGDAETQAERDMVADAQPLDAELYVVGHHGSSSSSSTAFVRAISPSYAFISCGKDNAYGHPTAVTLQTLESVGAQVFRTDVQGEVTCYANAKHYWFSTTPSETTQTTTKKIIPTTTTTTTTTATMTATATTDQTVYYTRTGTKYHYQNNCGSGTYYPCTLEEAMTKGLTPCSKCVK